MNIYRRIFSSDTIEEVGVGDHPVSHYFPVPMKDAVLRMMEGDIIAPSDYVLCPLYNAGDFQIGVTGSVEIMEADTRAISRELGEEIGLVPIHNHSLRLIKKYNWLKSQSGNRGAQRYIDFTVYALPIKRCVPVLEHQHMISLSNGKDDRSKKVGCYVYGDKDTILSFLSSDRIYRYKSEDSIVGIVALKATLLSRIVKGKKV